MEETSAPPPRLARANSFASHEPTALEQKMLEMKERFQMLRLIDESKNQEEAGLSAASEERKASTSPRAAVPRLGSSLTPIDESASASESNKAPLGSAAIHLPPRLSRAFTAASAASLALPEDKHDVNTSSSLVDGVSPRSTGSAASTSTATGTNMWNRVRKVVRGESGTALITRATSAGKQRSPSEDESPRALETPRTVQFRQTNALLESEDLRLQEFWRDPQFLAPFSLEEEKKPSVELPPLDDDLEAQFALDMSQIQIEISQIPAQAVDERKEAMEKALLEQHRRSLDEVKQKKSDTIWRENLARLRVEELEAQARERIQLEKQKVLELALRKETALGREFRKAREELEAGIKRQQGAVKEHFGKMLVFNESLSRRFNVFTRMFPQPVEFRIHILRAVKNKLPKGAYVLMLTQYDSLGGRPLVWSSMGPTGIGEARPGVTRIVKHGGRFFDRTMRFEDSVFALCPPRPMLKPSFVFVLELFQLASHRNPQDKIVAWTAVPMSFESMSLIEGKLKLPLMRGEHSPRVQHFRAMEELMAEDLSHWLCNVYLDVRHMSLHELGATEAMLKSADFDLDYLNKVARAESDLILAPVNASEALQASESPLAAKQALFRQDYSKKLEEAIAEEELQRKEQEKIKTESDIIASVQMPVDKGIFRRKLPSSTIEKEREKDIESGIDGRVVDGPKEDEDEEETEKKPPASHSPWQTALSFLGLRRQEKSSKRFGSRSLSHDKSFVEHRQSIVRTWKEQVRAKLAKQQSTMSESEKDIEMRERGYNLQDEVFLHPHQRGKLAGIETIDSKEGRKWAGAGLEGKIVRRWQSEGPRFDTEAIDPSKDPAMSPPATKASAVNPFEFEKDDVVWEELRDPREMVDYSMSLSSDPTRKKNLVPGSKARSKLRYLSLELFGDMVPYLFGTFDFYLTVFLYLFALWMRIYVHYLAQYLFIMAQRTPVYGFDLRMLFVSFRYSSESLSTAVEVGIVAIGPVACICVLSILLFFGHAFYKLSGFLPDVFSKFFAFFGVATVLDPLLTLLIDLAYHHYDCSSVSVVCREDYTSGSCDCYVGDFLKLWDRMLRIEGSGISGAFITCMIYLGCGVLSLFFLYVYLVYVHRDGRILDLWRRVNAPQDEFFIPDDLELSGAELQDIILKAKTFRSLSGSRRKVVIEHGIENVRDPKEKNFLARFQRVVILELDSAGRESAIYRQFVVDGEGKILEVFQDLAQKKKSAVFNVKTGASGDEKDKRSKGMSNDEEEDKEDEEEIGDDGGNEIPEEELGNERERGRGREEIEDENDQRSHRSANSRTSLLGHQRTQDDRQQGRERRRSSEALSIHADERERRNSLGTARSHYSEANAVLSPLQQ